MFVQRARLVRPKFELTEDNVNAVVGICARLDGIPLAIELAASRLRLLSPQALSRRLDESLEFNSADVERPDRQRTLRSTIGWSYDLLDAGEQASFRQLGVFAGGSDLEALEAVMEGSHDPLDEIASLVEASLAAIRDGPTGEPRVRTLQTVRAFAQERLKSADEWDSTSRRHAQHFLGVATALNVQLRSPLVVGARDRIELELGNFRAALEWCLEPCPPAVRTQQDVTIGLELCRELSWFWYACGYGGEGRRWLERAVERAADIETPELMSVLHGLGVLLSQKGQQTQAAEMLTRCLAFWRRAGDVDKITGELNSLAVVHLNRGDVDLARRLLAEGADLARTSSTHNRRLASLLVNAALLELESDQPMPAIEHLLEAMAIDKQLGNAWGVAVDQVNLVAARLVAGQVEQGYDDLCNVVDDAVSLQDVDLTINVIELLAALLSELGDSRRAARLLGAAETMRQQSDLPRVDPDTKLLERSLAKARAALGAVSWADHVEAGRSLSAEDAIKEGVLDH